MKGNHVGMAVFYVTAILMGLVCVLFNASVYLQWKILPHPFEMFWNCMLFLHFVCHIFHSVVYWGITDKAGYSDVLLTGSFLSFIEMYGYRVSGIIVRCIVSVTLIVLIVLGNVLSENYYFWLFVYPLCMLTLQTSNFQSDYRNAVPLPRCCMNWYINGAQEAFDKAISDKKKRDAVQMEERERRRKKRKETDNTSIESEV